MKGGEKMTLCKENKNTLPVKHQIVGNLIRKGKENATLLSDIMIVADIQDRRNAYQIIEDLVVKHGYVIGGSKSGEFKGYYIPANDKEFNEIAHTFKNTIGSMNKRYTSLLSNYKAVRGEDIGGQ